MKILIFDTETTGLPANMRAFPTKETLDKWPHIVQFGYIYYDTDLKEVLSIQDHIISLPPGVIIPEEASKIHGITTQMTKIKGIPFEYVVEMFMKCFAEADLVVAHNVEFDKKVLIADLFRINKYEMFLNDLIVCTKFYCTMQESTEFCNILRFRQNRKSSFVKFPTLKELCNKLFNYEPRNLHNALNDVVICMQCFYKLKFNIDLYSENDIIKEMIDNIK